MSDENQNVDLVTAAIEAAAAAAATTIAPDVAPDSAAPDVAVAAAKRRKPLRSKEFPECVFMTRGDEPEAMVNDNSIEIMRDLGWTVKLA